MSFEIRISETRAVTKTVGGDWTVVAQEVISGAVKNVYGNTPTSEKEVEEGVVIYTQRVDYLNLADVIVAVNGIERTVFIDPAAAEPTGQPPRHI